MQHKVIDLARLLNKEMPVYPDTAPPSFDFTNTVVKDGYREHHLSMLSHTGTHIDAPAISCRKAGRWTSSLLTNSPAAQWLLIAGAGMKSAWNIFRNLNPKISTVGFVLFHTGWQDKLKVENADRSPVRAIAVIN